jgi:hypothetical protein
MKKSIITYVFGVLLGSLLGLGSLAAASSVRTVVPRKGVALNVKSVAPGDWGCTTDGGDPHWGSSSVQNFQEHDVYDTTTGQLITSKDMTVTCRNLTSISPAALVAKLQVNVIDRGDTSTTRVWAFTECLTEDATQQSPEQKAVPGWAQTTQGLTFNNPWPDCTTTSVKVILPHRTATNGSMLQPFRLFMN